MGRVAEALSIGPRKWILIADSDERRRREQRRSGQVETGSIGVSCKSFDREINELSIHFDRRSDRREMETAWVSRAFLFRDYRRRQSTLISQWETVRFERSILPLNVLIYWPYVVSRIIRYTTLFWWTALIISSCVINIRLDDNPIYCTTIKFRTIQEFRWITENSCTYIFAFIRCYVYKRCNELRYSPFPH